MDDQSIQNEVILGVDTHLDTHVGAAISRAGKLLGTLATSTDASGYLKLLTWARSLGDVRRAGVEGTGTYGAGLARVLRGQGIEVLEVNRPDRSKRRLKGKSDPTDAENAARSVLSGEATAFPKSQCGAAEAMRTVSVARRSAVKAKTQAIPPGNIGQRSAGHPRTSFEGKSGPMRRRLRASSATGLNNALVGLNHDVTPIGETLVDAGGRTQRAGRHVRSLDEPICATPSGTIRRRPPDRCDAARCRRRQSRTFTERIGACGATRSQPVTRVVRKNDTPSLKPQWRSPGQ